MKQYRIYTEDKGLEGIKKIVSKYFNGFTIIYCDGFWKGSRENSIIIEIISENEVTGYYQVKLIAEEIKELNKQESVLITTIELNDVLFI